MEKTMSTATVTKGIFRLRNTFRSRWAEPNFMSPAKIRQRKNCGRNLNTTGRINTTIDMLSTFLSHQRKSFWRSRNRGGSIATQIILGFFILYFIGVALLIGIGMPFLLPKMNAHFNCKTISRRPIRQGSFTIAKRLTELLFQTCPFLEKLQLNYFFSSLCFL